MRYQESKETSAELLRLILPLMSAHAAAFSPMCYTMWYEYVSGINPELTKTLDGLIESGKVLGEVDVRGLFRRYISDRDEQAAEKLEAELHRVMDDLSQQAGITGDEAAKYRGSLAEYGMLLKQGVDSATFSKMVDELLHETQGIQGSVTNLQGSISEGMHEVDLLKQALQQAIGQALTDPLTGLKNRRAFDRELALLLEESAESTEGHSLLMLDVDHFKKVNDTYGHVFGDKVLRTISHVLETMVKGRDTVARLGGEEFAILLPDTALKGASVIAERIRGAIANGRIRSSSKSEFVENITVSFGVAVHRPGESAESLIERADRGMYESKRNGRNRVTVGKDVEIESA